MKPLVKWLKVKRAAEGDASLIEKVQNKVRVNGRVATMQLAPVEVGPAELFFSLPFRCLITCSWLLRTYRAR